MDRDHEIIEGVKRALADPKAGRVVLYAQATAAAGQIIAAAKTSSKREDKLSRGSTSD